MLQKVTPDTGSTVTSHNWINTPDTQFVLLFHANSQLIVNTTDINIIVI